MVEEFPDYKIIGITYSFGTYLALCRHTLVQSRTTTGQFAYMVRRDLLVW